jgi:hypothetical protein
MHTRTKMLVGALTAALVLASAISTASANRISTSNNRFRIVWTPLTLGSSPGGGGTQFSCNVTLEGSFHYNPIVKVVRSLVGYVTKAAVTHPCSGSGEIWTRNGVESNSLGTFPNTLPWHVTYEGFEGRLPEITGFRQLLRSDFVINVAGVLCGYNSNIQGVVKVGRGGETTAVIPDATFAVAKTSGGFLCPSSGFFTSNAENSRLTGLETAAPITVRLI